MDTGVVHRAFQIAPACDSIEQVRRKLKQEGFNGVDEHLASGALRKDLIKLLQHPSQRRTEPEAK